MKKSTNRIYYASQKTDGIFLLADGTVQIILLAGELGFHIMESTFAFGVT
jgi:hypothetical protein